MKMVSFKTVNVLTFVIVVMSIAINNSNADECLRQLIGSRRFKINFSGKDALKFAYRNLNINKTRGYKKNILFAYFNELYTAAIQKFPNVTIPNPKNWCENFKSDDKIVCLDSMIKLGYEVEADAKTAFSYGFNYLLPSHLSKDFTKGYHEYLLNTFLRNIESFDVEGPKTYCERFNAQHVNLVESNQHSNDTYLLTDSSGALGEGTSYLPVTDYFNEYNSTNDYPTCIKQLTEIGQFGINFSGKEAFKHAFNKLDENITNKKNKTILHAYFYKLYEATIKKFPKDIDKPLYWCVKNMEGRDKEKTCNEALTFAGIESDGNAEDAFHYAYFYIIPSKNLSGIIKTYASYMLKTFLQYVEESDVEGPEKYCKKYYLQFKESVLSNQDINDSYEMGAYSSEFYTNINYSECINELTCDDRFDSDFTSTQAFEQAYRTLNINRTSGHKKDILRAYFNDLYKAAIKKFPVDIINKPEVWCRNHISGDRINCLVSLNNAGYFIEADAKIAISYGYFYLLPHELQPNFAKKYYEYLLENFLPNIEMSDAEGPEKFCRRISTPSVNLVDSNQNLYSGGQITYENGFDLNYPAQYSE